MNAILIAALLISFPQDMAKQPPLVAAVRRGDLASAARLLEHGANPDVREILTSKPSATNGTSGGMAEKGESALQIAIERQSVPFVKLLLDHKADPNARDPYEWTPLMYACQRSNLAIVKLLLKRGAKPNQRNESGDTPIIFAANSNNPKIVEALIRAGADLNGGSGQTALMMATLSGAKETVALLLRYHADPNLSRKPFWTPLEYAVMGYDDDIVRLLKKAGAKGRSKEELEKEVAAASHNSERELGAYQRKIRAKNAEYAKLVPSDAGVIEAAVVDMANHKGDDSKVPLGPKSTNIIVISESGGPVGDETENQMNAALDERKANDIDLEMRRDLLRRNATAISLAECKFSDSHVVLRKEVTKPPKVGDHSLENQGLNGWVKVLLPGYSADGNRAVLRFSFGPTAHLAKGTYLLEKKAGKWMVVWRVFTYYV